MGILTRPQRRTCPRPTPCRLGFHRHTLHCILSYTRSPAPVIHTMAAPLAKGLIITASVLVAAGIAFYENEHIREFILNYRRKLAIALHSLGDEINPASDPRNASENDEQAAAEARRRRREEIVRLNRLEMIRQEREEGIAVDLDELVKLGEAGVESDRPGPSSTADRSKSFDALVGADGTLRPAEMAQASGSDTLTTGLRQRAAGARGLDSGTPAANPFDDEAQVLFDRGMIGSSIHSEHELRSRESTRTLSPAPAASPSADSQYFNKDEMTAQIEEAIRRSMQDQTINKSHEDQQSQTSDPPVSVPQSAESSYYYAPPPHLDQPPASPQLHRLSAHRQKILAGLATSIRWPTTMTWTQGAKPLVNHIVWLAWIHQVHGRMWSQKLVMRKGISQRVRARWTHG